MIILIIVFGNICMTQEEYKHILERYHSAPILKKLNIDPQSSEHPDMEYIDAAGRNIGIEITECWCRNVKLPEMDDYTLTSCAQYKSLTESRGERGLWITVWFYDSVYKSLPNMSKRRFMNKVCEEIDRHRKYDSVLDNPNIGREDIKELLSQKVFDYRFVSHVSVSELDIDFVEVSWTQGAFITTISELEVLRYIDKKNKALEGFKKNPKNSHINDYWLFLTVPDRTFCGIDDFKISQPIISDYERIYICDSMHVMQLK